MREKLDIMRPLVSILLAMSEGNPGAATVLAGMFEDDEVQAKCSVDPVAMLTILHLDDMNIRGSQLWVAFKDHCGSDMRVFAEVVHKRCPKLIETVNNEGNTGDEIAVAGGASYKHV